MGDRYEMVSHRLAKGLACMVQRIWGDSLSGYVDKEESTRARPCADCQTTHVIHATTSPATTTASDARAHGIVSLSQRVQAAHVC
jgi:hypothetical protein